MAFLSGKVALVILACVSVIIISSIVIPIALIFSGGESKTPLTTTKITTTAEKGKSNPFKLYAVWVFAKKFLQPTVCPLLIVFHFIQFPNMEQDPQYQFNW